MSLTDFDIKLDKGKTSVRELIGADESLDGDLGYYVNSLLETLRNRQVSINTINPGLQFQLAYDNLQRFLQNPDNVYSHKVKEISIVTEKTINEEVIAEKALQQVHNSYSATVSNYKAQIQHMRDLAKYIKDTMGIKNAKAEMNAFNSIVQNIIENPDWKSRSISGIRYMVYIRHISPEFVVLGSTMYRINEDVRHHFYVQDIKCKFNYKILTAYASRSNHPNINSENKVCLGDLKGKPFVESFNKVPDMLNTINMNSAHFKPHEFKEENINQYATKVSDNGIWSTLQPISTTGGRF